jgi:flagellar basal-body rod modification protein FlgD
MTVQSAIPFAPHAAGTTPSASTSNSSNSSSSSTSILSGTPTEMDFLQLLIAQMKYQDPSNPQDATQFVSELAQFSQLQETVGIRQDTDTLANAVAPSSTSTTSTSGTNTNPTS